MALLAIGTVASAQERTKITLLHHGNGEVQVYDTLFETASGFSVQKYLQDKGFDPAGVEIIHTNGMEGRMVRTLAPEVWIMKNKVVTDNILHDEETGRVVRKVVVASDEDEIATGKVVVLHLETDSTEGGGDADSSIFHIDMELSDEQKELVELAKQRASEASGEFKQVEVRKVVSSDGAREVKVWVNGEELDGDAVKAMEDAGEIGEMEVRIKAITGTNADEETQEAVEIWMEAEELDTQTKESPAGLFSAPDCTRAFTVAIVSSVPSAGAALGDTGSYSEQDLRNIRFFPNPTGGRFRLTFELPGEADTALRIYSADGRQVYAENLPNFSGMYDNDIDLSGLPSGTYLLNILREGTRIAEKIIIQ